MRVAETEAIVAKRHFIMYSSGHATCYVDSRRQAKPTLISFGGLLIFGALAALANLVGGLMLASPGVLRLNERLLKYLVALGAGFMLAAIFIEIVPQTFSIWTQGQTGEAAAESVLGAMTLLLAGYLLIQLFEHTIAPHFPLGAETRSEERRVG